MTAKPLRPNISTVVRDRRSAQIDHLQETIHCESNRHVADNVTSPQKTKVMGLWDSISWQPCEIDGWFKLTIYGKIYTVNPSNVTDDVTCPKCLSLRLGFCWKPTTTVKLLTRVKSNRYNSAMGQTPRSTERISWSLFDTCYISWTSLCFMWHCIICYCHFS